MQFPAIDTAPREEGKPLILFCPGQGGWHSGTWFEGRWRDFLTLEQELFPSHFAEMLPDPQDEGDERASAWEATRAFG